MASGEGLTLPIAAAAVGIVGAICLGSQMNEGQGDQYRAQVATVREYQGTYAPGESWPAPYDKSIQLPDGTAIEGPYSDSDVTKATQELNGAAFREDAKDWLTEGGMWFSLLVFAGGAAGTGVTVYRRWRLGQHHDLREDVRAADPDMFPKDVYKRR